MFAVDANGRRVGYWHRPERFGDIEVVNGELWMQCRGEGLRRWSGGAFVPIAGTQAFGRSPLYDLFALADGSVLVHDVASGLSLWQQGKTTPLVEPALQNDMSHLTRGVALGAGHFAFAGDDGRLRVFDLAHGAAFDSGAGRHRGFSVTGSCSTRMARCWRWTIWVWCVCNGRRAGRATAAPMV